MINEKYLYNINYSDSEVELAYLEMRTIFKQTIDKKIFGSNLMFDPSISPFLKNRIEILYHSKNFEDIPNWVKTQGLEDEEFLIKYIEHGQEDLPFKERREKCKLIGLEMLGYPSFDSPKVMLALLKHEEHWYFGKLEENNNRWIAHREKPKSYSSAINHRIAKAITNIATEGNTSKKMIDPCCGVGTVIIEAIFSGYNIVGRDINFKVLNDAIENLAYFDYKTELIAGKIEEIKENYDVSIVDLPYGILSRFDEEQQNTIMKHAGRIAKRVIFVSSEDIQSRIEHLGISVIDSCKIIKSVNKGFTRFIWVCKSN